MYIAAVSIKSVFMKTQIVHKMKYDLSGKATVLLENPL